MLSGIPLRHQNFSISVEGVRSDGNTVHLLQRSFRLGMCIFLFIATLTVAYAIVFEGR